MLSNKLSNTKYIQRWICRESERIYTAFQADGSLWQWKRISFGLSNAVPAFQRVIDDIIKENDCKGTVAYLDNITVGGKTQEEHDKNLAKFFKVASDCNLTFNEAKYSLKCYETSTIQCKSLIKGLMNRNLNVLLKINKVKYCCKSK